MARLDFGSNVGSGDSNEHSAATVGTDALFQLGLMYSAGRDVDLDLIEAHKWFNLAALRGNQQAKILRQEIAMDMCRADISAAQRRARQWLSKN